MPPAACSEAVTGAASLSTADGTDSWSTQDGNADGTRNDENGTALADGRTPSVRWSTCAGGPVTGGSGGVDYDAKGDQVEVGAPVISGGVVLLTTSTTDADNKTTDSVNAYDETSGALLWSNLLDEGAYDAVISAGTVVLAGPEIEAFDATSGRPLWTLTTEQNRTAPSVDGDTVFVAPDPFTLEALDIRTGAKLWSEQGPSQSGGYSQVAVSNGRVIDSGCYGDVTAYDETTGKTLWSVNLTGGALDPVEYPTFVGADHLVVAYNDFDAETNHFFSLDPSTGATQWTTTVPGFPLLNIGATHDRVVSIPDLSGTITALNADTGTLVWAKNGPAGDDAFTMTGGTLVAVPSYESAMAAPLAFDAESGDPLPSPNLGTTNVTVDGAGSVIAEVNFDASGYYLRLFQ